MKSRAPENQDLLSRPSRHCVGAVTIRLFVTRAAEMGRVRSRNRSQATERDARGWGCGLNRATCCYLGGIISITTARTRWNSVLRAKNFYDRIWSTPMTRVAAELGTTPGRLSSLIRRAGIPTPPSGYWIKKEFGKAETQPPLPPAPPDCFEPLVLDTNADTTRAPRPETAPHKAEPEAQPLSEFEAASAPAAPRPHPHHLRPARCGDLRINGVDVGSTLIDEGLAVRFVCGATSCPALPRPWC